MEIYLKWGLIFLTIGAILFFIKKLYEQYHNRRAKINYQDYLPASLNIVLEKNKLYDFSYRKEEKTYLFKLLIIPKNSELVINSKYFWQVNKDMRVGKGARSSYFIKNLKPFLDYEAENAIKCIVVSDCYKIMQVVNECEMAIISNFKVSFGTVVIKSNHLKEYLESL